MKSALPSFLVLLAVSGAQITTAQKAEDALRKGNDYYRKGDHVAAGQAYQQANSADPNDMRATFNLGDAEYKQGKFPEAQQQFEQSALRSKDPVEQARAYHNIGNAWLGQKKPEEAIKAYREALRRDPSDEDTRYNLAYAQRMLQQQQEQQKNDQKKDENKDEEKKDQEKQDQEKQQDQQKKDEEQEQKQDQQQKQDQPKEGEPQQPQQMSKQDAERILDALDRQEQKVQEKVREKQRVGVRVPTEKDW
ncbi:MAG: tetratricopeptide repeat protein [Flavobacteriales bacterium]|nr:tetratricopeptide repeat protein [Flavobacteriales bacterium]